MVIIENKVYFDTDCLSAFLWTNEMGSLFQLFKNNIVLPRAVYNELYCVSKFRTTLDNAIANKLISIVDINYKSKEMDVYKQIMFSDVHYKEFGKGEAEVITHAVCNTKEMASNNLSDVDTYIKRFNLINYTIADILDLMLKDKIKTIDEIEVMWVNLISRNFKLPYDTYKEYIPHRKIKHNK